MLDSLACRAHDSVGLVAEVGSELAMRSHHFAGRMNLLLIAGRVRRNLSSLLALPTGALQILTNLLTAGAGRIQVFLAISLNLRAPLRPTVISYPSLPQSVKSIQTDRRLWQTAANRRGFAAGWRVADHPRAQSG